MLTSLSVAKSVISKIRRESRFFFPTLSRSKSNIDLGGVDCACCVRGDCGISGGVLAWGRGRGAGEGGEVGEVSFSYARFGGGTVHFRFATKMAMVRVQVAA